MMRSRGRAQINGKKFFKENIKYFSNSKYIMFKFVK